MINVCCWTADRLMFVAYTTRCGLNRLLCDRYLLTFNWCNEIEMKNAIASCLLLKSDRTLIERIVIYPKRNEPDKQKWYQWKRHDAKFYPNYRSLSANHLTWRNDGSLLSRHASFDINNEGTASQKFRAFLLKWKAAVTCAYPRKGMERWMQYRKAIFSGDYRAG